MHHNNLKHFRHKVCYQKIILETCNFSIVEKYPFHISDGLFSKFLDDQSAINLIKIDKVLCKLPFFKKHGNNIILHCKKISL